MAAYVKQADQVVLILTKAEATALRDLMTFAHDYARKIEHSRGQPVTGQVAHARERACRALSIACEPGSRPGASIK